jgi:hypothetical protein
MVYTWIEDWLKNRTQMVQFGGDSSSVVNLVLKYLVYPVYLLFCKLGTFTLLYLASYTFTKCDRTLSPKMKYAYHTYFYPRM